MEQSMPRKPVAKSAPATGMGSGIAGRFKTALFTPASSEVTPANLAGARTWALATIGSVRDVRMMVQSHDPRLFVSGVQRALELKSACEKGKDVWRALGLAVVQPQSVRFWNMDY